MVHKHELEHKFTIIIIAKYLNKTHLVVVSKRAYVCGDLFEGIVSGLK